MMVLRRGIHIEISHENSFDCRKLWIRGITPPVETSIVELRLNTHDEVLHSAAYEEMLPQPVVEKGWQVASDNA